MEISDQQLVLIEKSIQEKIDRLRLEFISESRQESRQEISLKTREEIRKELKNELRKEIQDEIREEIQEEVEREYSNLLAKVSKNTVKVFDATKFFREKHNRAPAFDSFFEFKQAFDEEEIKSILKLVKEIPESPPILADGKTHTEMRKSIIKWIEPLDSRHNWLYEKIAWLFANANKELYQVNISGFTESIQFTIYDADKNGGFYDWHADMGKSAPHRKLSMSIQLSDESDYDGCDLQLQFTKAPFSISKKKGSAVVFPSFTQHRVLPITRGKRIALVCWISGPPYV